MIIIGSGTKSRYGLHLPHLVRVLSTIVPIIGSLTASHTRAIAMITLTVNAGMRMVN